MSLKSEKHLCAEEVLVVSPAAAKEARVAGIVTRPWRDATLRDRFQKGPEAWKELWQNLSTSLPSLPGTIGKKGLFVVSMFGEGDVVLGLARAVTAGGNFPMGFLHIDHREHCKTLASVA